MAKPEENMANLKNAKTRVTVGDSRIINGKNMVIGTAIRDMTENSIV